VKAGQERKVNIKEDVRTFSGNTQFFGEEE
jgi:hypothetical protein